MQPVCACFTSEVDGRQLLGAAGGRVRTQEQLRASYNTCTGFNIIDSLRIYGSPQAPQQMVRISI